MDDHAPAAVEPGAGRYRASVARFRVELETRFIVGRGALRSVEQWVSHLSVRGLARGVVVCDDGLLRAAPRTVDAFESALRASGFELLAPLMSLPGGERCKQAPRILERVIEHLHDAGVCRQSLIVALGGGALLDVVGYAAALTHRGVRIARVPTTTLSQADSCAAVKNGVNHLGQKNFLGTFSPADVVVVDPNLLVTLADHDWRDGFSEAVKVALVKDRGFFAAIERDAERVALRDLDAAEPILLRALELHRAHIEHGGDPFERETARPLDFGHWAAHRLESLSGQRLSHGHAVAIGVAIDTLYSAGQGWLPEADARRVLAVLRRLGFELWDAALESSDAVWVGLEQFRAHLGGKLTLSMLRSIGTGFDVYEYDRGTFDAVLEQLKAWNEKTNL